MCNMFQLNKNTNVEKIGNNKVICDPSYINNLIQNNELLTNDAKNDLMHYALYAANEAQKAKRYYYIASTFTIAVPLIVSILQLIPCNYPGVLTIICAILSASVSFAAAALSLFKFHDRWIRYRNYIEMLISCIILRLHITPDDPNQNPVDALLRDLNQLNQDHMELWIKERTTDPQIKQN